LAFECAGWRLASYSLALLFLWASVTPETHSTCASTGRRTRPGPWTRGLLYRAGAYEQRWVNISGALAGGLTAEREFPIRVTQDFEHDAFNRIASYIAIVLIACIFVAAASEWRRNSPKTQTDDSRKIFGAMIALGVVRAP